MTLPGRVVTALRASARWSWVALLFGCAPGRQLSVPFTSAAFATESRVVLHNRLATGASSATLYDLAVDRPLWTRDIFIPSSYSWNGEYGAWLQAGPGTHDSRGARVIFVDLKNGTERKLDVWMREETPHARTVQRNRAGELLSVSDDGASVATFAAGKLCIYSTATSKLVATLPIEQAHYVSVRFLPGNSGAIVAYQRYELDQNGSRVQDDDTPYVRILRRSGAGWETEAEFVAWSWAPAGGALLLVTPEGIVRYQARTSRLLVPGRIESYLEVSPDGRNIAFEYQKSLRVYQLDPPRQLFTAKTGEQFRLNERRLVVFEEDGDLFAYALPAGKPRQLRAFGKQSSRYKSMFHEGSSIDVHYEFFLGPFGRYATYHSGETDTIVHVDDL